MKDINEITYYTGTTRLIFRTRYGQNNRSLKEQAQLNHSLVTALFGQDCKVKYHKGLSITLKNCNRFRGCQFIHSKYYFLINWSSFEEILLVCEILAFGTQTVETLYSYHQELSKPPEKIVASFQDIFPLCLRCHSIGQTWHTKRPKRGANEANEANSAKKAKWNNTIILQFFMKWNNATTILLFFYFVYYCVFQILLIKSCIR